MSAGPWQVGLLYALAVLGLLTSVPALSHASSSNGAPYRTDGVRSWARRGFAGVS